MEIGGKRISIARGLELFLGITVLSITLFFVFMGREMLRYFVSLRLSYALLGAVLAFLMWCSSAMKFHLLLRGVGERISFWKSFQAFMANLFMGAITPSQTGGGLAQIYLLNRAGVPVGKAFIACTTGAGFTILALFSSAVVILILNHSFIFQLGYLLRTSLIFAAILFLFFLSLYVLAIVRMKLFKRIFGHAFLFIGKALRLKRRITYTKKMLKTLEMFSESIRLYATTHARLTLLALLFGYISLGIYCLMASVILSGLGLSHSVLNVVLIQILLSFIAYFSPSPGASGIAEGGSYLLMSGIVTNSAMRGAYTLLWRFFTNYIGVTVGGLLFMYALNSSKRRSQKDPKER
jgi:hypothetical protein